MYIFAKAQENLKAAELLIANAMYASSIHCSYYASLQLSKRKLMESGGLSYDQQDQEVKKQQTDTHNFVIFSTENCVTDTIKYRHLMCSLKRLRKKADYQNHPISQIEATEAQKMTKEILNTLG